MKTENRNTDSNPGYLGYYKVIAPLIMCSGVGDGQTTACVMAQAATIDALRHGKTLDKPTDEMECACPILRRMAIRANDASWWRSDLERTEYLRPLIPLLLDSRVSPEAMKKRMYLIADSSVRVITPMRLEFRAQFSKNEAFKAKCAEGAKQLRELSPITDKESALKAREVCLLLKKAAYAAAYAQKLKYRTIYLDLFHAVSAIKD